MKKLTQIERDVESLSADELAVFRKWFQAYDAAQWDRQLENDALTGKLDRFEQEAITEHQDQRTREL